ncbi:MAG: hypothetical protein Q8M16_10400 [Pirellulaceae bacterium]|nr:hypothetical protein [Pirellulaceae bacterium]
MIELIAAGTDTTSVKENGMSEFPIRNVDRNQAQSVETVGSKPKFWFRDGKRRLLFKADDRGTGEDWAEMVVCELCRLIGLPHVEYELACEVDGQRYIRPGVVCENMSPSPAELVLGNELLLAIDPQYPVQQRFKVRQHSIDAVSETVVKLEPPAGTWMPNVPVEVKSALEVFAGYVMLDAWVANQDRHHENWGAIRDNESMRLAPTFDHGAALARNLLDSEREERLTTKDTNRAVSAFVLKGRSAFYGSADQARSLELKAAFLAFAERVPSAANAWIERLRRVDSNSVWGILERVPNSRMSVICKQFTMELLQTNQKRLLE